jgi:hypothetical protein
MEALPQSLNCPNCGAPLPAHVGQALAVCLYCNSAVRLQPEQPTAQVAATVDQAEMAEVKQLLLDGKPEQALERYQQASGLALDESRLAFDELSRRLSLGVVRGQQLTRAGILWVIAYALSAALSLGLWAARLIPLWLGLLMMGYSAMMLLFYFPALRATLAFRQGKSAQARVVKLAPVGVTKFGRTRVHIFKLLVEVTPQDDGAAYPAEMLLPVREQNLPRAKPDTILRVKYLPHDPQTIIYDE